METSLAPALRAVCVHGAGGGGWEWTIWARVFAALGWDVAAPDLRPAAAGLAATGVGDYLDQVGAWVAPTPDLLVGASLGGLLALAVALARPPRALVLVNPLPPQGRGTASSHAAVWPDVVPWGRTRSLAGTRRALPDADAAACLWAWRRWRDESGRVLREAAGVDAAAPSCPVLVLASRGDVDVPMQSSRSLAQRLDADFLAVDASHVGPLLGRQAGRIAAQVAVWAEQVLKSRNAG